MAKKKVSEVNKTVQEIERKEMESVSLQIQAVLESNGYALQPFMQYSEYGISPRVKLIKVPKIPSNDEQATNTGEASESKDEDGTTESK